MEENSNIATKFEAKCLGKIVVPLILTEISSKSCGRERSDIINSIGIR